MLSEDALNEILDAFIDAERNPSEKLQAELAKVTGKTQTIIWEHYRLRCLDQTNVDVNDSPRPMVG